MYNSPCASKKPEIMRFLTFDPKYKLRDISPKFISCSHGIKLKSKWGSFKDKWTQLTILGALGMYQACILHKGESYLWHFLYRITLKDFICHLKFGHVLCLLVCLEALLSPDTMGLIIILLY